LQSLKEDSDDVLDSEANTRETVESQLDVRGNMTDTMSSTLNAIESSPGSTRGTRLILLLKRNNLIIYLIVTGSTFRRRTEVSKTSLIDFTK